MVILGDRIKITVGKDGEIFLNEPTVKQLNEYNNRAVKVKNQGRKIEHGEYTAAAKLFDELFDEAVKVEVRAGGGKLVALTAETLKFVPARKKRECIDLGVFQKDDDLGMDDDEPDKEDDDEPEKN